MSPPCRQYLLKMKVARRVLVTGGAGFIGSHVVDRFVRSRAAVIVLDDLSRGSEANLPPNVPLLKIDIATADAVAAIVDPRPDVVIHCAAQTSVPASFDDPVRDAGSNLIGSLRVIEGCRRAGVTDLIYVTTGGALYGGPMVVPWDEQAAIAPISPYGISKFAVETYLGVLAAAPRVSVLRFANVYGPRQGRAGESGVVATFIARMAAGLPVVIDGDGEQTRDLLFVADAVEAIISALETSAGGTFNIGTGSGTSVNALYEELAAILDYTDPPMFGPVRVGDIRHSTLDSSLAWKTLHWRARTRLPSGLATTVEEWRATQSSGGIKG